jgi:peptidoglycan-associated lipoprotein
MRIIFLLAFLVISTSGWAQSLKEATKHFEKYEYVKAAKAYELVANQNALPEEDFKRLAYAYFINGQYQKCLPLSDSIINMKDPAPIFYYINGDVNLGNRNYEKAKESFDRYSKLDDEFNVQVKIASCDSIPYWEQEVHVSNKPFANNSTKADISGQNFANAIVVYKEIGKDSSGVHISENNIDNSELVLARPYLMNDEGVTREIIFNDSTLKNISVSSIWIQNDVFEVWLTINQPMSDDPLEMAHHLYIGEYSSEDNSIANINLWEYGGYTDTSACAHATVNTSGNLMVFTKIGANTKGADLYVSKKKNDRWSQPRPLTELNTDFDDLYPMFIGDSILSFSSDGRAGYGNLDIFMAEVSNGSFGDVQHVKSPVNSFMDDFNFHFYQSQDSARYTSNRDLGVGDDDMYFVKFSEPTEELPIKIDSSDFFNFANNWEIPRIYFEYNKFKLQKDFNELEALVAFLKVNPKSSIIIVGHTDNRGSADFNDHLGYNRANSVSEELKAAGVSGGQISLISKGATEPESDCQPCTEAEHAKNRVVLIKLNAR